MLVMYSHTDFDTHTAKGFYYYFYLFGFFFASGYVYKNKDSFDVFVVKKLKSLMIPWFTFGIFNIALGQVMSFGSHSSLVDELKYMFLQVRGLNDKMWFLAALFVAFIPFYFIIKRYEATKKDASATFILIGFSFALSLISRIYTQLMNPEFFPWKTNGLPWHLEYMFVAMFWLVMGYLFRQWEENYDKKIDVKVKVLSVCLYMALVVLPYVVDIDVTRGLTLYIYSYVAEFVAIFALIYVSKLIKPNKYLLYIGQNTLICFGIHGKTFSVMQKIMQKLAPDIYIWALSADWKAIVVGALFTVVLSIVLIVPIYIINRWFPFMLGKPMKAAKNNK